MRYTNKKKLKKYESILLSTEKPNRGVVIFNPNMNISDIDYPFFIALPDKGLDPELTKKIGTSYVLL